MKKAGLFILFLILTSFLVIAQGLSDEGIPGEIESITNASEKIVDVSQNITREDYLKQEWQKILLNNPVVSKIDAFFKKGNMVFKVLFGVDYSLSLTLIIIIVLWLFVVLIIKDSTKKGLGMFEAAAWILGIVGAIALSQLKVIPKIASFAVYLVFSQESGWVRSILFIVVVIVIVLLFYLNSALSKTLEAQRKKRLENESEQAKEETIAFNEGLKKGRNT